MGCVMTISVLAYLIYMNSKTFIALKDLDLGTDSIVDSAKKSNKVKSIFNTRYKNALVSLPLLYSGIVLIAWNSFTFNMMTTIFILGLFIILFSYNLKGSKIHKNMIERLEREIFELNEYIK